MSGPAGKTAEVQKNDNAAFLPKSAEATEVLELNKRFVDREVTPTLLIYGRESGLTDADKATIAGHVEEISAHFGQTLVLAGAPDISDDGKAAQILLLFDGTDSKKIAVHIDWLREHIRPGGGLEAHVGGVGGIMTDLMKVFESIDGLLLGVTVGIILLILLVVYRSPLLPLVVLFCAGLAYTLANGVVYLLAREGVIDVSGQSQAILNVLVLGAATDYAMLLVSRFREELRGTRSRFDAIRVALRASFEPILASGATVILGLMCLLVSDLSSNKGLGPVGAIGIAASLAVSLTLLPAVLALCGRVLFWPFRPLHGSPTKEESGIWARVARLVGKRARIVWIATMLFLLAGVAGLSRLDADGIPQIESFTTRTDSVAAQELINAHFPGGIGSPAEVVVGQDKLDETLRIVGQTEGVASAVPYTGSFIPNQPPKVVDGLVRIDATLNDPADSDAAIETVKRLRANVHPLDAKVGGFTAINHDVQSTSQRDRTVIIPLVLAVIFLILTVLLRSLIAPLVLIATVVLSYLATLGISGYVFTDLLGMPGADSSYPLFAFVFLVALGVDYNIFLMTRVREEAGKLGHFSGTLKGLSVTGGVITSAGIVLAATFAALAVLPIVFVAQIAFAVAFGVLLDTLVVRSLLVPALSVDIGRFIWWPGRLRKTAP
ncbi:MMPL family transporter [Allorhizocola rhizosphaerae]|uniref:MMPL family transporter n=1 Tax=Allorhizocola rhizosphaerae TaxID=1872709 RepID=UPI001FEC16F0|nr:MMPL family transporter [Allorhizocola rhizosphaerae]